MKSTTLRSILKRSDSRRSVHPGGKSWKKKQAQRSVCKVHLKRAIERKRALKK